VVKHRFNNQDWQYALNYFEGKCAYCGQPPQTTDNYQVLQRDHCIPSSRKGPHHAGNVVPCCQECNSSKGDRDLDEWLNWRFEADAGLVRLRLTYYFTSVGYEYPAPAAKPKVRVKTKGKKFTFPEDYNVALARLSDETGMPIATIVRRAVKQYLAEQGIVVEGEVQQGGSYVPLGPRNKQLATKQLDESNGLCYAILMV
jgi:hypothetical protein